MVKSLRRTGLACGLALLAAMTLQARDFANWRIGDTADQDVIASVALDVADPESTAALKTEAALKTPVVYHVISSITNTMVLKMSAAFAEAHTNFLAGLQQKYHQTNLDATVIQSVDFENFVTAFNVHNRKISITTGLAIEWAQGGSGLTTETGFAGHLLQATRRPVRPDAAPDGFEPGDTVRLMPVRSSKDVVTLEKAEQRGALVSLDSVTTVTRLRGLFRRDFSAEDQLFARTLATYIHPNCELDTNLTRQARERAVGQIVMVYQHYAVGQAIVRRGQVIDGRIKAALTQLNEVLPPELASQPSPGAPTAKIPGSQIQPPTKSLWPVIIIMAVTTGVMLGFWRFLALRRRPAALLALPTELAPQITEMLKSAVVQELAVQRRELLQTQQIAAEEVVRLMHRLNDLHAPSPDRLAAYERRIGELEKELSIRTEENRELLKLKIDLLRQQIETERVNRRVNFN